MKRFSFIFAAAALALASCGNESKITTESVEFSAVLSELKTTINGNTVNWEAGDIIYISTDKAEAVYADGKMSNAVKVVLDEKSISSDGKTAYFTAAGLPQGAKYYFAYAVGQKEDAIASISTTGMAVMNAIETATAVNGKPEIRFVACGAALKGSNKFNMQNITVPATFTVEEDVYKLTLEGKNGEVVADDCSIKVNGETVLLGTNEKTVSTVVLGGNCHEAAFFLAPGITLEGYVIKAWSDDSTLMYEFESSATISAAAGYQKLLGTISEPDPKTYYSKLWEKGEAIDIDGVKFAKADGLYTAMHITDADAEDGAWTLKSLTGKIVFVDEGITVRVGKDARADNSIIVGDLKGSRNILDFTGGNKIATLGTLVIKNFKFINGGDVLIDIAKDQTLYIDDCHTSHSGAIVYPGATEGSLKDFRFVNSDWYMNAEGTNYCLVNGLNALTSYWGSIVIKNNIFFGEYTKFFQISRNLGNVVLQDYTFVNNSVINLLGRPGNEGAMQPNLVTGTVEIHANLVNFDGSSVGKIFYGPDGYTQDGAVVSPTNFHIFFIRANGGQPSKTVGLTENDHEVPYDPTCNDLFYKNNGDCSVLAAQFVSTSYQYRWLTVQEASLFKALSIQDGECQYEVAKKAYKVFGAQR